MKRIFLNRADIKHIQETLEKFPEVDNFCLELVDTSGIGYTIDMVVTQKVNGVDGKFTIPIVGVEDW
jgi:hypothetical protein